MIGGQGSLSPDSPDSLLGHQLAGLVIERARVLNRPDARLDRLERACVRLNVTRNLESCLACLRYEELDLVGRVSVGLAVHADLYYFRPIQDVAANRFDDLIGSVGVQVFGIDQRLPLRRRIELPAEASDDDAGVDKRRSGYPALVDGHTQRGIGVIRAIAEVPHHREPGGHHRDAIGDGLHGADRRRIHHGGEVVAVVLGLHLVGEREVVVRVHQARHDVVLGEIDHLSALGNRNVGRDCGEFLGINQDDLVR